MLFQLIRSYIERTYLAEGGSGGRMDPAAAKLMEKMRDKDGADGDEKKVREYGFDALFLNDK